MPISPVLSLHNDSTKKHDYGVQFSVSDLIEEYHNDPEEISSSVIEAATRIIISNLPADLVNGPTDPTSPCPLPNTSSNVIQNSNSDSNSWKSTFRKELRETENNFKCNLRKRGFEIRDRPPKLRHGHSVPHTGT